MSDNKHVRVFVLELSQQDIDNGDPFSTLVKAIADAWDSIPPEYREHTRFQLNSEELDVWYDRAETDDDRRDRAEYERLSAKFSKVRPI